VTVLNRLRELGRALKHELTYYRLVAAHERTPALARVAIGAAVAYAAMPIDLIPDWIPILGHLDDLIVVPALVYFGMKLVPTDVRAECRREAQERSAEDRSASLDRASARE